MALASSSSRVLSSHALNRTSPSWSHHTRTLPFTVSATPKKLSSSSARTGRFDSKNRKTGPVTTREEEEIAEWKGTAGIEAGDVINVDDGFVMPELPGREPDFFEGPQWDAFGFFVQYMWAFGVLFAFVACGVAVGTYNEGATDFKDTPVYKESIQSRELLEEPDASNSDVFESNPTEEAPSLE